MVKANFAGICILFGTLIFVINADFRQNFRQGVNGGIDCATCTVFVGLVEKLSTVYNESIVTSLERFCNYMPVEIKVYCRVAVDFLVKLINSNYKNVVIFLTKCSSELGTIFIL